ncbi:MAG: PAS domain S-box protein [Kiritimatiellae bacterium]|nr:PAS domain S-box protein [Kiritimatiellia bacterium]
MVRLNHRLRDPQLFRELVNQIYSQLPSVVLTSLLLVVLVVLVLWRVSSPVVLLSWMGILCLVCLLRYVLYGVYRARGENHLTDMAWVRLYSWGAIVAGVAWASAPLLFYSSASPQTNVFIAFVLGGLVSGASGAMAPLSITMCIFTGLLCLPIAALFITHGGSLHTVMGVMMLIYGGAYVLMSQHTGRTIIEALGLRKDNIRETQERKKVEAELRKVQQGLEDTVDRRAGEIRRANDQLTHEIAERQQAESRLRASEERYRNLVESSSDWIWEVDSEGVYTYSSPSVQSMLGYTPDEVVGQAFDSFMPPDEAGRMREIFEQECSAGKPFIGLINRCLHKDGTERIMETNGEPVFGREGNVAGFRGIDRDITLRVKHEAESRKI